MPQDVKRKVMIKCLQEGESLSAVVRRFLAQYADEDNKPTQKFMDTVTALNIELYSMVSKIENFSEEKMLEIKRNENLEIARRLQYYTKTQDRIRKKVML